MIKHLDVIDRNFVDNFLLENMSLAEALCAAEGKELTDNNKNYYTKRAYDRLDIPVVNEYYLEMRCKMAGLEAERMIWNRDIATEKLTHLIDKAEAELYEDGSKITMSRMNAVVLPVKELNELWGLKEQNINLNTEAQVIFKDEELLD